MFPPRVIVLELSDSFNISSLTVKDKTWWAIVVLINAMYMNLYVSIDLLTGRKVKQTIKTKYPVQRSESLLNSLIRLMLIRP